MNQKEQLEELLKSLPKRTIQSTLFNIANAYAIAANVSWGAMGQTQNADLSAPALMCQSFSIEILLKFFLANDHIEHSTFEELKSSGIKLRGHKYSELFDQISTNMKNKIAKTYSSLSGKNTDANGFRDALVAQGDDPFVYWRYIYETNLTTHFDNIAFGLVLDALGVTAEQERKITEGIT